ncbi:MAG: hypothetical protein MR283_06925 [Erysipelotrichaceae bacterium]|nr:hypothetical protein [Erysipelotrichaceae bacterium]
MKNANHNKNALKDVTAVEYNGKVFTVQSVDSDEGNDSLKISLDSTVVLDNSVGNVLKIVR